MQNFATEILRNAKTHPDKVASRSEALTLSYAELEIQSWKAAHVLKECGVKPGDVVGLAMRDAQQSTFAMLGTWVLGATFNLLNYRSTPAERAEVSKTFNHRVLFEDSNNQHEGGSTQVSLTDWEARLDAAPATESQVCDPEGPAVILLSSGTTGKPTGFEISHAASFNRARAWQESRAAGFLKGFLCSGPLSFGAYFGPVCNTLFFGGTVTYLPPLHRPKDFCRVFHRHQIAGCVLVPTALRDLLEYVVETGETLGDPLGDQPWIFIGGAMVRDEEVRAVEKYLSRNVVINYGSSQVGAITNLFSDEFENHLATVGRPVRGTEVQIVDENDVQQPVSVIGSIRIRTASRATVIHGRDPKGNSDRFVGDWFYPGDLGFMNIEGYLTLVGRSTDVIIRGGANVYPQEIETVVVGFPAVKAAAALGFPDERLGEEIALFVVVEPGVDVESLLSLCRTNLPPDKRPKRIEIVADLPLNANGKLIRRQLADKLRECSPVGEDSAPSIPSATPGK